MRILDMGIGAITGTVAGTMAAKNEDLRVSPFRKEGQELPLWKDGRVLSVVGLSAVSIFDPFGAVGEVAASTASALVTNVATTESLRHHARKVAQKD